MKPNPIFQSPLFGSFLGAKVDGLSLMQVHPLDPYTLIHVQPSDPVAAQKPARARSSSDRRSPSRTRRRPAFTAEEARHHFAIEALDKSGPFRPQPYLYTCVRCKWIFRINDARGSIIALDGLGRRLPEPENAKRIVTFHRGPCPAFPVLDYLVPEIERESRVHKLISKILDVLRGLIDRHRSRTRGRETTTA
jgi:hypothetical protein